jgi:rsbT co-antagonist protein RsbR
MSAEDLSLVRTIAGFLHQILQGKPLAEAEIARRDELGIVANLALRVAREVRRARERHEAQRHELERRVAEIEEAFATQERLVATIQELSVPVLRVYRGVLLLPLIGSIDATRAELLTSALLDRVAEGAAEVVILDVTGLSAIDADVAALLSRAAQGVALLGARTIVCGMSGAVARVAVERGADLGAVTLRRDLGGAIATAIRFAVRRD